MNGFENDCVKFSATFFHCVYFFASRLIYSSFMFFHDALTSDLRKFVLAMCLTFFDFVPNIRHKVRHFRHKVRHFRHKLFLVFYMLSAIVPNIRHKVLTLCLIFQRLCLILGTKCATLGTLCLILGTIF